MYRHVDAGTSFAGEASKAMGPTANAMGPTATTTFTAPRAANTPKSSASDSRPPVETTLTSRPASLESSADRPESHTPIKAAPTDFRPPVRSTDLRLDPAQSAIAPREGEDVTQHTPHTDTTKENR